MCNYFKAWIFDDKDPPAFFSVSTHLFKATKFNQRPCSKLRYYLCYAQITKNLESIPTFVVSKSKRPGLRSLIALLGRFSEKLTVTTLRKRGRSGVTGVGSGCLLKTSEEQAAELSECNQAIRSLTRRSREENF